MKKIYVYSKDKTYGEKLAQFIDEKHNPELDVKQLTELDEQVKFRKEDVIITDFNEVISQKKCEIIRLVYDPDDCDNNSIFVFQDREKSYRQILEIVMPEREKQGRDLPKITCVFSIEGSERRSEIAMEKVNYYSKMGKVLYVSFAVFGFGFGDNLGHVHTISELLLCTEKEEFIMQMKGVVKRLDDFEYIPPVNHYKDLLDFDGETVRNFLINLNEQKVYDYIVIEMSQMFEFTFDILGMADVIIMPEEDGKFAKEKNNVFHRYCLVEGHEKLWRQIRYEKNS